MNDNLIQSMIEKKRLIDERITYAKNQIDDLKRQKEEISDQIKIHTRIIKDAEKELAEHEKMMQQLDEIQNYAYSNNGDF